MKKLTTMIAVLTVFAVVASAPLAKADMLRGDAIYTVTQTFVNNGVTTSNIYLTPMMIDNLSAGQSLIAYCGDFTVTTSAAFSSSTGQAYNAYSMSSPELTVYSSYQKSLLTDLFSHVYGAAYDTTTGEITSMAIAQSLQLAIWEILTETTEVMDIASGSFYAANLSSTLLNTTTDFLSAATGLVSWESLGLGDSVNYDLTVYVAEGGKFASQTLISITAPPDTTPEPASLTILGFGAVAGAAFLRRRKVAQA